MTFEVTSRMRKALENLCSECDYEDSHNGGTDNFILHGKLGDRIGDKTISQLLEAGFIKKGPNRWVDEVGFRITDAGREAIE